MPLQLASSMIPKNDQTFYLMEDIYIKGGFMILKNIEERDALPILNLKLGQIVYLTDDKLAWQVSVLELPTLEDQTIEPYAEWAPFEFSSGVLKGRQVAIHTIEDLQPDSSTEFELELGLTAMVLKLEVSRPVEVWAYSTPLKDEPNPYTFLATLDHLYDDGTSLLSDGTILRSRRYSTFSNMESPPQNKIYMTINAVDGMVGPVILTVTYLVLETVDPFAEEPTP